MGVQPGADAQDDTRNEGCVHFHLNLQYIKCIYRAWNDVGKAWRAHDHEGGTDQSRIRVLADVAVDSDVKPVDVYDDTDETDGRYGEVHAFKRRCGNGNHDRATILPILFGELDRIMKAQMARGADFKKGNPVVRLKKLRTVILPLFQNAISRPDIWATRWTAAAIRAAKDGRSCIHSCMRDAMWSRMCACWRWLLRQWC